MQNLVLENTADVHMLYRQCTSFTKALLQPSEASFMSVMKWLNMNRSRYLCNLLSATQKPSVDKQGLRQKNVQ